MERRNRRQKPKKKKTFRFRLFLLILFLVIAGIAGYYVLSLPIWKIQDVSVIGTSILSAEEIRNLSGIPLSENLFLTSFARTRSNLKRIAAIKEFSLYRIPPGTVLIKITERKPIAMIVSSGASFIVDDEGFIINRNPNLNLNIPNLSDLPVISGITSGEIVGGERIDPQGSKVLTDILFELSKLFGAKRTHLELGRFQAISFLLDDLLRVKLGRGEDITRKMEVFKALLPVINDKWNQVEYVDVRYPDNPVIKYR